MHDIFDTSRMKRMPSIYDSKKEMLVKISIEIQGVRDFI